MKKSHLTLAILTAVLVSACGGSSSNDDATQDHGKPITPSKTTPTKTTPTTPTTNDNSAKKPSTPTTSTTPSDSTPSTPITPKTPTETTPPKTKTPITPAKTLEQAKADLDQDKKKLEETTKKAQDSEKDFEEKNNSAKQAAQALAKLLAKTGTKEAASAAQIAEARNKAAIAKIDADNARIQTLEAFQEQVKAQKAFSEDMIPIKKDGKRDTVKEEKERDEATALLAGLDAYLAQTQADVAAAESAQKQLKVENLEAEYSAKADALVGNTNNQTKTRTEILAEAYKAAKEKLSKVINSGDQEKIAAATKDRDETQTALEKDNSELKGIGEELAEARTEAKEAETKAEESQKAAEEAKNKLTPEEKAAALAVIDPNSAHYNGVRFSDAENDTFGEVRKVSYDKEKGQWSIVFKDKTDTPLTVSVPTGDEAKKPYGTFTAAKGSKPAQGVKATAYSAYGFVGDKFFSVGKLKNLSAMSTGNEQPASNQTLKYEGTAFVNATVKGKETPQVAVFNAEAKLGDKTLTGSFSHFTNYTAENFNDLTIPKEEAAENEKVTFTSTINPEDSSFKSADDAKVKVQGFFYQAMNGNEESSAVGGLVDSKKEGHVFKGAFGGVKAKDSSSESKEKAGTTGTGQ